jgi:hypothetical protein
MRPVLLPVLLLLSSPCAASGGSIGGRFGFEVDGLGEEYQSYGVFDDRLTPDDSIEEQIEQPVRSRQTRILALLHLNLRSQDDHDRYIQLQEIGRAGSGRQRNSLSLEAGLRGRRDRLRIENQWHIQGGEEEPTGGAQDFLTMTWDRTSLPWGLRSQVRLGADWSSSAEDTLAAIFDYRSLRGHLQLRRDLTSRIELRALVGNRRKDAFRSASGSYDSWFTEWEVGGLLHERGPFDFTVRAEERSYREEGGIPSSREVVAEGRYELSAGRSARPYCRQRFEWQDYEESTDIFEDHWSWAGELGTDLFWRGRPETDPLLGLIDNEHARFRVGGKVEVHRAESDAPSDSLSLPSTYDSFGAVLGVAREGFESFWADLTLEAGYRDYRREDDSGSFVFDGLNLSFTTSDYVYLRATLLMEWTVTPWLRADAFLQWDEELHRQDANDFRLWILNASLTYPF